MFLIKMMYQTSNSISHIKKASSIHEARSVVWELFQLRTFPDEADEMLRTSSRSNARNEQERPDGAPI